MIAAAAPRTLKDPVRCSVSSLSSSGRSPSTATSGVWRMNGPMRAALREHHLVIEGAAALALAASLRDARRGRHVVILSGANVGEETLRAIL